MNVIVIMLDSLRVDHLGCYGNSWIKTPNIDEFAKESTIFERAYAEGLPTIPVRTALFTGRYTLPFRGWRHLDPNDILLAEILWNKGYRSALISDTYHMHKPRMGFSRGFDEVIWIRGQESDPYIVDPNVKVDLSKYSEKNYSVEQYRRGAIEHQKRSFVQYLRNTANWKGEEDHFVAQVMKTAANWLEKQVKLGRKDKIFLWIDSFDPHEPWDPPEEYYRLYEVPEYKGLPIIWAGGFIENFTIEEVRHIRAQYAGEITLVDKWVGMFLEKVEELGLLDNTLIVILSDHGEPLGEHGIIKKVRPWPYEELSRIPLIIRHPEEGQGRRIKTFVDTTDIMPTILDFLEIEIPNNIHGRSLMPLILGEEKELRNFAISGHYGNSWSIRNEEWSFYLWLKPQAKYTWGLVEEIPPMEKIKPELYRVAHDFIPPRPSQYDPERDVAEKENLIDNEPEVGNEMELVLRRYIDYIMIKG